MRRLIKLAAYIALLVLSPTVWRYIRGGMTSGRDIDIVPALLSIEPSTTVVGDGVTINFEVKNSGRDFLPERITRVVALIDGERVFSDYLSSLAPGKRVIYGMRPGFSHWVAPGKGFYNLEIRVNGIRTVRESDYSNNIISKRIEVVD